MARPVVSAAADELYESLPEVFRIVDVDQAAGVLEPFVGSLDGGGPAEELFDGGTPGDPGDDLLDGGDPDDVLPPGDGDFGDPDDTGDTLVDGGGTVFTTDSPGGYPLLRWLDLICSQIQPVRDVIERLDVDTDADISELVDPMAADAAWLPWLAQLVGVVLNPGLPVADQRAAIVNAPNGWQAGSKASIAAAAQTALTGSRYVQVFDHRDAAGAADEWHVLLITRADETPDGAAVIAAVIAAGAKPAGVVLTQLDYSADWDTLEGEFDTWDDGLDGLTWDERELSGL